MSQKFLFLLHFIELHLVMHFFVSTPYFRRY